MIGIPCDCPDPEDLTVEPSVWANTTLEADRTAGGLAVLESVRGLLREDARHGVAPGDYSAPQPDLSTPGNGPRRCST